MRNLPIETVRAYKDGIEKAFNTSKFEANVKDVYILHDHVYFFENCVVFDFGTYSEDINTQLNNI